MNRIAIIGGGPFGVFSAASLSKNPNNEVTIFESSGELGGMSRSEKYKGHYLDYTTKFIPCNQFGKPGMNESLEALLKQQDVLLDEIGDYHFLANGKDVGLPPVLKGYSKLKLIQEATRILKYFPAVDEYVRFGDIEKLPGFKRGKTISEMMEELGISSFARLIEYFGMIFGISFEGAESLAVINSRNDYFSFNYLRSVFYKNRVSNLIAKRVDKDNLLLKDTAIPYKFLMLTSGYDRFFQRINEDKENVSVSLNQQIVDLDRSETADSGKYTLISSDGTTFDGFDQVVLAIPMKQIKKIKYDYIQQLTKSIGIGAPNFVLTSFCNLDTSYLTHLPKGIYLDDNNPYKVGMPDAKRDGSLYGLYKHFYADSMFQSLTMVNDIDPESIDESFIHDKWHQALKAFGFDVKPTDVKPYSWHVVKWECPFPRTHDFAHFEKLEAEQGKKGIWFGGEMLSGSGIPVILRYVESLFGPVV